MRGKIPGIYAITNKINGKVYIGSSLSIKDRWRQHVCDLRWNEHHSRALQRAWNKYGADAFHFAIVELVTDPATLFDRESHYITLYRSADGKNGYNSLVQGGSARGYKHTDEARRRMSEAQKKIPIEVRLTYCRSFTGRQHTAETKAKMSANSKRVRPTPEQRQRISEVHKGKTISDWHRAISAETCRKRNSTPEHIEKVRAALKGRKMSEEQKAKLSASTMGRPVTDEAKEKIRAKLKGRVFSAEHRAKISAALRAKKAAQTV